VLRVTPSRSKLQQIMVASDFNTTRATGKNTFKIKGDR
jgi:hypothetical protein